MRTFDGTGPGFAWTEEMVLLLVLVLLSLRFQIQESLGQHFFLVRPVPSDSLPVEVLKEDQDPMLDPHEKNLNETELRVLLGVHFNPDFMSVSHPEDQEEQEPGPNLSGPMPKEIQALELEVQFGLKHKPNRKLRRRLQHWIWTHTLCPVLYTWTDLGLRFWPRYQRTGSCYSKRSCSVPEGMFCKPNRVTYQILLRWFCPHKKVLMRCGWIQVQYPVISECKCSCPP